jgi:YVTN family beta-propeller protein
MARLKTKITALFATCPIVVRLLPAIFAPKLSARLRLHLTLLLLVLLFASTPAFGAALAYVVNNSSNNVTVFDLQSHSAIGTIPVGTRPTEICFAPDNRVAYVTNEGSNSVSVINLTSQTVTATVPVGVSPSAILLSLNGRYAYVVNAGSNDLTVLDTSTDAVLTTITLGTRPVSIRITSDGLTLFIANQDANSVTAVNTADLSVVATIPVGLAPNQVVLTPDNQQAYTINTGSNNVTVIDARNFSVIRTIPVGTNPAALVFSVDGQFAYVTNRGSNTVSQINLAQGVVSRTFNVGVAPLGIALRSDGNVAYVSNSGANSVTVLDIQNPAITSNVVVGQSPLDVRFDPSENLVYATNRDSSSVSVIDTTTDTVTKTVTVGSSPVRFAFLNAPRILAISQDTGGSTGGTRLQIIGKGFVDGVRVDFGGSAATVNEFSPFALRVTTNGHNPGIVDVTVVNPDLSSDSLAQAFTFQMGSLNYPILFPSSTDSSAFRTNLGLNNLSGSGTTATVSLVNPSGSVIGSKSYPLPVRGLYQINNINRDLGGTNTNGSLQVTANAPISGFASIIDNSSQDPSIEVAARNGDFHLLIPSVTNVGAFRSNVIVKNLSAFSASVNLTARDTNGIKITTPRVISIPGGGTFESADILTFLGTSERFGPLETESLNGAPLIATSRVYSSSPLGGTNGGFLEGQRLTQAATALFVPFVTDTAEFRTNVGLNNPGNVPASVTILFIDRMGTLRASGRTTVPASGMTQINSILRKLLNNPAKSDLQAVPDSGITDQEGYLQIISSQPLIVWASQIDNQTNDPGMEIGQRMGFAKLWLPSSTNTGFFRSTLSLLNTQSVEAKVDVLGRDTAGNLQGSRSVVVPPNGLFYENDILSSLGLSGAFGPLEINVANGLPVIAISRVYSTNGTSGFFESRPID